MPGQAGVCCHGGHWQTALASEAPHLGRGGAGSLADSELELMALTSFSLQCQMGCQCHGEGPLKVVTVMTSLVLSPGSPAPALVRIATWNEGRRGPMPALPNSWALSAGPFTG